MVKRMFRTMAVTVCLAAVSAFGMSVDEIDGLFSSRASDSGDVLSGEALIRKQFVDYFVQQSEGESGAEQNLKNIREDGTWPDIDYASRRRGEWPTRNHLDRLNGMATAWADPASTFYRDDAMKQAVLNGLDHWIQNDYPNPNWYNPRIGVPYRLGCVLVLMGDAVPAQMLADARPILDRSELGMTGQNKVWCAGIGVMKGVLFADRDLLERAVDELWSELQVSTGEGIQPDWSFHQHGPQQQFGNYGLSFGADMVQWASILRGTDYALSGEQLKVLRNYLLEGPSWIVRNGRMDLSGCGRQVDQGCQQSKARRLLRQLDGMTAIDPRFAAAYESTGTRVGFKPFWRSDMAVQRRPDWVASVKMSSTRVIGSESCNSENMQGLHLGDGVLLTCIDGDEYEDIVPLWDWKRLPGTTCDQGLDDLTPSTLDGYGRGNFAGVLGDGEAGMAAMEYDQSEWRAQKSWFFTRDAIVCLGRVAGETRGPVYTSVQQSRLQGEVSQGADWIVHDQVGYQFLDCKPVLEAGTVTGNWNTSFPTRGDRPAKGEVFSLWIDHGKNPADASYAYLDYPGTDVAEMNDRAENREVNLLRNDWAVQAVQTADAVYAVFIEAGVLECNDGLTIEVEAPCMLMVRKGQLTVCDPRQVCCDVNITLNGQQKTVELPSGAGLGKQTVVDLPMVGTGISSSLKNRDVSMDIRMDAVDCMNSGGVK
jgi:chondroitin AC lyase